MKITILWLQCTLCPPQYIPLLIDFLLHHTQLIDPQDGEGSLPARDKEVQPIQGKPIWTKIEKT